MACVFAVLVLQIILHAQEQEEPPATPPSPAEEAERLKTLKKAEFEKLKSNVFGDSTYEDKLSALKKIAALNIPESVGLFGTLYDNPMAETDKEKSKERVLIVELLGQMGSPAAASTVLKAAQDPGKDGKLRLAAAAVLPRVMEKQALPHLKKLTEDKLEAVKNRAWLELLKIRDMKAMRHVFKLLEGKEKLTALEMIKKAHFTEAVEDVAKLAKETDFSKGPNEKILKLKALETALGLGHKESVEVAIELIGAITEEQAKVLEVRSPLGLLSKYTQHYFKGDKKKFQEWWTETGNSMPLFSCYVDSTTLRDIGVFVADLLRKEDSSPLANAEVIYCIRTPLAEAAAEKDKKLRPYNSLELWLLGVSFRSVRFDLKFTNGKQAMVTTHKLKSSLVKPLPLEYADGAWRVGKMFGHSAHK
jgi:hypothetical protein